MVSGYGSSGNGDHSYAWDIPEVLTDNLILGLPMQQIMPKLYL